jgi:spectinomycin phosphotransferase
MFEKPNVSNELIIPRLETEYDLRVDELIFLPLGGGIDEIWKSKRDESVFYEGYGKTEIDLFALAYYRYERIIEDLAVICEQLLSTQEGGADRERSLEWFMTNFEPGNTLEIARNTDELLLKANT